ncbi:flagellar biosynthesis protein FlhF [Clostridium sartagoforme]|uniref:Flagellar biosynthesis protein FlhF n=1 Tax=Clostridium sartagoforme TaxID=84031 RepID=A0A4S2DNV4_9CLOT|nr:MULTISPECIES: flagellar biosynthesis protein FlhF [Clostridium]MBS5937381.1 flagellar biosynthesis protein FlhF [Clostridium sp.]TGY43805.1 flagellar biosynthesis protein FlhF [Clostridium sartagoforme]
MLIKKYLVKNMNEAMTRIRYELGKDAIIISQRKVRESGVKGYFKPKLIEVTAALENSKVDKKKSKKVSEVDNFKDSLNSIKSIFEKEEVKAHIDRSVEIEKPSISEKADTKKDEALKDEVKEIKELLNKVIKNTNKEKEALVAVDFLRDMDIEENLLEDINLENYEDIESFKDELKEVLKRDIEVVNKDLKGNVVLIGPTGVGKTTTIAKLAGRLALIEKKKVGLITIDTYRIGAVEQLKTYAEIMNIPFKVVITLKEMEEAINSLSGCDVVLVDTTGRSSKNTMQISELRAFIQKVNSSNISLVISGTTKNKDIDAILSGYGEINYEDTIVTKLDETTSYGCLYNIAKKSSKPISYITVGQNVPDDIKVPSKDEIIKLILGEESVC